MPTLGFTVAQVVGLMATCLVSYWLKGLSGFGSALVFVPAVSLLFDPRTAIASAPLIDLVVGVAMVRSFTYDAADRASLLRMTSLLAVGAVIGAGLTGILPDGILLALVGAAVVVLGARLVVRPDPVVAPVASRSAQTLLWLGCFVGGLLGGLIGISGPPVVAAARPLMSRDVFRRRMAFLFMAEGIVKLVIYALNGVWTAQVTWVALLAAPAVGLGLVAGYRTHLSISERSFNLLVGITLTVLGLRVLTASLG